MVVKDTQKTKNLSDFTDIYTITKLIDPYRPLKSPLLKDLSEYYSKSKQLWYVEDKTLNIDNFGGLDTLYFNVDITEMLVKNIIGIRLSFTLECNNQVKIDKVGISRITSSYKNLESIVNDRIDVDVSIDISESTRGEYISLIRESIFDVFIQLSSDLINTSIKISNIELKVYFTRFLQDEIDAVYNRLDIDEILEKPMIMALGLGYFHIDEEGYLWVELPQGTDNPFWINEQGELMVSLEEGVTNEYHMENDEMHYGSDN